MPTIKQIEEKFQEIKKDRRDAEAMQDMATMMKLDDKKAIWTRKLEREKAKQIPMHPALQFGPVTQTITVMCAISMVSPLPYEMIPFYKLFSAMSVVAMSGLVLRNGVIYYGYKQALSHLPPPMTEEQIQQQKWKDMLKFKPPVPDDWAHPRSHPSHFLTTKNAPPRLFPFPLGKTRPGASVADELWWEGGNAPHVGHFKKREMELPDPPDQKKLMAIVKKKMEMEALQALWKKRIRSIQMICVIVVISFFNRKIAVILLVYTIYQTLTTEFDAIFERAPSSSSASRDIKNLLKSQPPYQVSSELFPQGVQGMGHIYSPDEVLTKGGKGVVTAPIMAVPPPVLMTTDNHFYTGVGESSPTY